MTRQAPTIHHTELPPEDSGFCWATGPRALSRVTWSRIGLPVAYAARASCARAVGLPFAQAPELAASQL